MHGNKQKRNAVQYVRIEIAQRRGSKVANLAVVARRQRRQIGNHFRKLQDFRAVGSLHRKKLESLSCHADGVLVSILQITHKSGNATYSVPKQSENANKSARRHD